MIRSTRESTVQKKNVPPPHHNIYKRERIKLMVKKSTPKQIEHEDINSKTKNLPCWNEKWINLCHQYRARPTYMYIHFQSIQNLNCQMANFIQISPNVIEKVQQLERGQFHLRNSADLVLCINELFYNKEDYNYPYHTLRSRCY